MIAQASAWSRCDSGSTLIWLCRCWRRPTSAAIMSSAPMSHSPLCVAHARRRLLPAVALVRRVGDRRHRRRASMPRGSPSPPAGAAVDAAGVVAAILDFEERVAAHRVLDFLREVERRELQQANGVLQPRRDGVLLALARLQGGKSWSIGSEWVERGRAAQSATACARGLGATPVPTRGSRPSSSSGAFGALSRRTLARPPQAALAVTFAGRRRPRSRRRRAAHEGRQEAAPRAFGKTTATPSALDRFDDAAAVARHAHALAALRQKAGGATRRLALRSQARRAASAPARVRRASTAAAIRAQLSQRAAALEALGLVEVLEQHLPAAMAGLAVEDHPLEHRAVALALVAGTTAAAARARRRRGRRASARAGRRGPGATTPLMAQQPQRDLQLGLRPVERLLQPLERPRRAVVGGAAAARRRGRRRLPAG